MEINESVNLNGLVKIMDGETEKIVMNIFANLDTNSSNYNINYRIINRLLVEANIEMVQTQIDEFVQVVKNKATEMGYVVFI